MRLIVLRAGAPPEAALACAAARVAILGAAEAPLVWGFRVTPRGAWRAFSACGDGLFVVNVCLGPLTVHETTSGMAMSSQTSKFSVSVEVVFADFWTGRFLSSSPFRRVKRSCQKCSITSKLKSC